jgi:glycosyltransferase involved in cell wall biosynthesis
MSLSAATVLTLTWEFPPLISGGLGMACYGLVRALLGLDVEVLLVLPATKPIIFKLVDPSDADTLAPTLFNRDLRPSSRLDNSRTPPSPLESLPILRHPAPYGEHVLTPGLFRAQIEELLPHLQFDVIHAHDWLTFEAGICAREMSGKPLICHVHSTEYDRSCGAGDERIRRIEGVGLAAADRVIAVSRYTADRIAAEYGVRPDRIRVVHNAYVLQGRRRRSACLFEEPVILFLGRMTRQKGPDIFLEMARRLSLREHRTRFIMAGEGDMLDSLIARSASYGMTNRLLFTGFLDRRAVQRVLSISDLLVAPSISDPFNISILEAMSMGLVCLVSSRSGVTELVRNILTFDHWDIDGMVKNVLSLLRSRQRRAALGARAAEEAKGITWQEPARKMLEIYGELIC